MFFEYFILLVVIASSIIIAYDNPLNDSPIKSAMYEIDVATTSIFVAEMLIKVIAKGFLFCGPGSYIRDKWNVIDFLICITSVLDLMLTNADLDFVKFIRLLRAIKPFRVIGRNEGLKVALRTLMKSAPALF